MRRGSGETLPKIKGVHRVRFRRADGEARYHYVRRGGERFWTEPDDGTDPVAYAKAYEAAKRSQAASAVTVGAIVARYLESPEFNRLSDRTKRDYRALADSFADRFKTAPAVLLCDRRFLSDLLAWRDTYSHSQKRMQYAWTVAKLIANWAQGRGMIAAHVISGGTNIYKADRSELVWTPADIKAFNQIAPPVARRVLGTALSTGLRAGDLAKLSRSHIVGNVIQIRTSKRARVATIPIVPEMRRIIDETPADRLMILVNERGRPLTAESASKIVSRYRDKAKVNPDLHLHDCRGTAATRLVRSKVPFDKVAIIMGWSLKYAVEVVANYVALDPENMADVVDLLNAVEAKSVKSAVKSASEEIRNSP